MPRKRHRCRGAGSRRPAAAGEGAADVVMDSGRNSDYVERLAFKYMRKCKVESSTDSESDNNWDFGTNVPIPTSSVNVKTMDFQKLQFLDPYDGDSEDTIQSNSSECDQKCTYDDAQVPCTLRDDSMSMDCGLISTGDPQCEAWNIMSYSDPLEKVKIPWQSLDVSEKLIKSVASVTCSSDLSLDSRMVIENAGVASGSFLFIGADSRVETSNSSVFPTSLTSEENSDFSMFETSLIKRKGGIRLEGEKMKRKKLRVSENMT